MAARARALSMAAGRRGAESAAVAAEGRSSNRRMCEVLSVWRIRESKGFCMPTRHNRENGTFLRQLDTEKYRMDAGIYPFAVQLYQEIGRISACSRNVLRIPIITYYTGCIHVYCHKQILKTVTFLARWASAGRDDLFLFVFY